MSERWQDPQVQNRIIACARFCECALREAARQRTLGWGAIGAWERIAAVWSDIAFREVQPCTLH